MQFSDRLGRDFISKTATGMKDITKKRIVRWFWIILLVPITCFILLVLAVWAFADIPSFEELENPESKLATQVIAEDGEILTTFHIENRSYVTYGDLSPYLIEAAVATEDVRFYSHSGIDFQSLARVLVKTLLLNDSSQGGGSTITQQLAKTLYPRENLGGSIPGVRHMKMVWIKLKEWITAVKLERNYTKNEILTMYMNAVFFGSNAYGIKTASQTFFSKDPSELNAEESAMLVGMVNKPTRYNPVLNPDKALGRRNFVLGQMAKAGYLTGHEADSLCALPVTLAYHVLDHNAGLAPYFRDMLRRTMNAKKPERSSYSIYEDYKVDSLQWADNDLYGWLHKNKKTDGTPYSLDRDGLRIYTTINYKMQQYAEEAVAEHLGLDLQKGFWRDLSRKKHRPFSDEVDEATIDRLMSQARRWSDRYRIMKSRGASEQEISASFREPVEMRVFSWDGKGYIDTLMTPDDSIRYYKSFLRAAFMAIEPQTGHIKAYVGGPDYRYFMYDMVSTGKRQVGSTIKAILYTLAMQEGLGPCDKVPNIPQTFVLPTGETWTPRGGTKRVGEMVTLRWGLANSENNISAWVLKQFTPEAVAQMAHKMGITSFIDPVPSIFLGTAEISVKEMVAAFSIFANKGVYSTPLPVYRIEDKYGNVLDQFQAETREVITERTAYLMCNLLEGVVQNGTGVRLRYKYKLTNPMGGKTGTTQAHADGWFMGVTPELVGGVWVGAEDRSIHFQNLAHGQGANMALPIWAKFLLKAYADPSLGLTQCDFEMPAGITKPLDCDDEESAGEASEMEYNEDFF